MVIFHFEKTQCKEVTVTKITEVNKYSHACAIHYGLFICEGSEAYTSQATLFHPGSIGPREGRYHMTSQHRRTLG